jgi:dephospho-CoA kinase
MDLFGITGGIGMGKSAAGEILATLGVRVIDTDLLAREEVAPGTEGLAEIVQAFGTGVLDSTGALRRDLLARRVFSDPAELARLNGILHPRIRTRWQQETGKWRDSGVAVAAVTIPLLFENGYEGEFSQVVCVACSEATQRHRLRQRGWHDTEVDRRNGSQWPVSEKMKRAQRVIWTEGSLSAHAAQWRLVLRGTVSGSIT